MLQAVCVTGDVYRFRPQYLGIYTQAEEHASLTMLIILKLLHRTSQKVLLYPLVKKLPTGPLWHLVWACHNARPVPG